MNCSSTCGMNTLGAIIVARSTVLSTLLCGSNAASTPQVIFGMQVCVRADRPPLRNAAREIAGQRWADIRGACPCHRWNVRWLGGTVRVDWLSQSFEQQILSRQQNANGVVNHIINTTSRCVHRRRRPRTNFESLMCDTAARVGIPCGQRNLFVVSRLTAVYTKTPELSVSDFSVVYISVVCWYFWWIHKIKTNPKSVYIV